MTLEKAFALKIPYRDWSNGKEETKEDQSSLGLIPPCLRLIGEPDMNSNYDAESTDHSDEPSLNPILDYWNHLFGDSETCWSTSADGPKYYLGIFSGLRPTGEKGKVNKKRHKPFKGKYFSWPGEKEKAATYVLEESNLGLNVYSCAHLLTKKKRIKENAAPILTLWADGDEAEIPTGVLAPTLTVESSPSRHQFFWRLNQTLPPREAEDLNQRLTYKIGADETGWDLTQLLRPPGTRNWDYAPVYDETPVVRVIT
jgi:hypothetical protein